MKRLFLGIIVALLGTAGFADGGVYQIPNSDFETWASSKEPGNGWNSFASASGALKGSRGFAPQPSKVTGHGASGSAVKISSSNVYGKNANGNLTTGTVNMGAMEPSDPSNYNYTNKGTSGHYLLFAGRPDAVSCYAKFTSGGSPNGRGNFILHGDVDYRDPEISTQADYKIGIASIIIPTCTDWTYYEASFSYSKATPTTQYMLASFTTNPTPGGSADDGLIFDDVKLIYYSQLATLTYDGSPVSGFGADDNGSTYTVNSTYDASKLAYTLKGTAQAATVKKSYNDATGLLTITVSGNDISVNSTNVHTYYVQFNTTTTYSNYLAVSVNGSSVIPQSQNILITKKASGTYDLELDNFVLGSGDSAIPVGNIVLTDITPSTNSDGSINLQTSQNITITKGSLSGVADDDWLGPNLGTIPVSLSGTIKDGTFICNIDIDMTSSLGQTIKVAFAPLWALDETSTSFDNTVSGLHCVTLARTLKAGYWNTICLPFDMTAAEVTGTFGSDATIAKYAGVEGTTLSFTTGDNTISAGVPCLIKTSTAFTSGSVGGKNITNVDAGVVKFGDYTLQGTYSAGTVPQGAYFINSNKFYYADNANVTMKGFRAYVTTTSGGGAKAFDVSVDGQTTAVEGITTNTELTGAVYNLNGQQVRRGGSNAALPKGVYIQDGKKIVIR